MCYCLSTSVDKTTHPIVLWFGAPPEHMTRLKSTATQINHLVHCLKWTGDTSPLVRHSTRVHHLLKQETTI